MHIACDYRVRVVPSSPRKVTKMALFWIVAGLLVALVLTPIIVNIRTLCGLFLLKFACSVDPVRCVRCNKRRASTKYDDPVCHRCEGLPFTSSQGDAWARQVDVWHDAARDYDDRHFV